MLLLLLFLFSLGTILGSFLLVLADRLPLGKNPWRGRSKCDHCKKTLQPIDLIPLVSFVMLGGKCRFCKKKLSFLYPLVELATGVMFVLLFLTVFRMTLNTDVINWMHILQMSISEVGFKIPFLEFIGIYASLLIIFSSFLVILIADMKFQVIPDEMLISSLVGTFVYMWFMRSEFLVHMASGVGALMFFLAIFLGTRGRGMGFGDVKLAFVLGLFLGFPNTVVGLYLAFLTGAVVSLILVITRLKKWRSRIAFGPFLLCGAVITFFYGNHFVQFIIKYLG